MDSREVVLHLAAEILEVLALLEMGEHLVEQEQLRLAARYRAADAGQVVHLADSPGESCLTALIRAGYDEDAFRVVQAEVIADYRPVLRKQNVGQRNIECRAAENVLRLAGDPRIAETKPGSSEPRDEVQVGDVELHFPVADGNHAVKITVMTLVVVIEGRENVGVQLCYKIKDARFDVVHVRKGMKRGPVIPRLPLLEPRECGGHVCEVIPRLPLLEPRECGGHVCAVVSFRVILADLDPVT